MKKNDFDNRLQNDLFPEMPASFESGLKKAMEQEGVRTKKRPTATGVFAGAVSLLAAAACLLIVLIGVTGGGRSDKSQAAAPGETSASAATEAPRSTPAVTVVPMTWPWSPKVFTLSTGFEFKNEEKLEALYTNILYSLMRRGESEPDELWLCAIKSRYVKEDTGDRADGYLSGYYVLAQHAFGEGDGPELYCLSEDLEVLWCTEGSSPGPNHAVNPEEDNYTGTYQGHFLYGVAPTDAHVTRGALVGSAPGTDIEFSMAASITKVEEALKAADSQHLDCAREFFLVTVPAGSWDSVMEAHTLRVETEEGPVDVNMENDLPLAHTLTYAQLHSHGVPSSPLPAVDADKTKIADPTPTMDPNRVKGVEFWLSQNMPLVRDFTDDWYGEAAVEQYVEAVRRALLVSGEHIQDELWICGVACDQENEDGTPPASAYVLALNAGDGEPSPELFYYENGRILWMTQGADIERINVVYHNGNTIVFGKSPAFDNRPLAMTSGKIVLKNGGSDALIPVLTLDEIQKRITGGPHYYSARECFLWMDGEELEVKTVTVTAEVNGQSKAFGLNSVNVLTPQDVPAMAVKSAGTVYPGRVTHMVHSLNEDGVAADGTPLMETMGNGLLFKTTYTWQRPLTILTASDAVTVDTVDVYLSSDGNGDIQTTGQLDGADLSLSDVDGLAPGTYFLCFRTTVLGPYSEKIGRYTFQTDYTIYKVDLK